ncbi:MAG TPA: dTMP kinase [Polyangiaceae bacterium]
MFVVFEGIDGSGKTTLSNRVAKALGESSLSVKHLRADGRFASSVTEAIRELCRDSRHLELVPQTEFLLYVAREVQLTEEVLKPALAEHDVVIADRFLDTPRVLARHGRHLPSSWTEPVLEAASQGIVPDLVVLVDVDPALARARRKAGKLLANDKRPPSRKGLAGVGLQHRLRRGYLELAAAEPSRWLVVDNEGALEETVAELTRLLRETHELGAPAALARSRRVRREPASPAARGPSSVREALEHFLAAIERRSEREPHVAARLLAGLYGPRVDERRGRLARIVPEAVLDGLVGLADASSFEIRAAYAADLPRAVARSLAGLSLDERAARLRRELVEKAPLDVASVLGALEDDEAWAIRERAYELDPGLVTGSLGRIGSARAWEWRERWLGRAPKLGDDYEASRVAAKSVAALDDDRAWAIRDAARPAAPVAALASVTRLVSERSFALRRRMLRAAPKVVMETLRGIADPRAAELRRAVASDCKEALDSVYGLDGEDAWALREEHALRWPSTVIKSLGPLADGPRGRALVDRVLVEPASGVSLLKHLSAIALGCHVVSTPETL